MEAYSGKGFLRNFFAYGFVCDVNVCEGLLLEGVAHLDVCGPYVGRRSEGFFLVVPSETGGRSKFLYGIELLFKLNRHERRIHLGSLE